MISKRKFILLEILTLAGILLGIAAKSSNVHSIDLTFSRFIQSIQPQWFILLGYSVSLFEFGVVFIVLPLFIFLLRQEKNREAYFVLAAGLAWFIMRLLKATFAIPCPIAQEVKLLFPFHGLEDSIRLGVNPIGYLDPGVCYPSGHVFDYISIWGTIYYLREKIWRSKNVQKSVAYLSIFLISFVGIARISLGAHFLSDVVGGYLFGFAWLIILIDIYRSKWV